MKLIRLLEADDSRKALLALQTAIIEAGFDTELVDADTVTFTVPIKLPNEKNRSKSQWNRSFHDYKRVIRAANGAYNSIIEQLKSIREFSYDSHNTGFEVGRLYGINVFLHVPDDLKDCHAALGENPS